MDFCDTWYSTFEAITRPANRMSSFIEVMTAPPG